MRKGQPFAEDLNNAAHELFDAAVTCHELVSKIKRLEINSLKTGEISSKHVNEMYDLSELLEQQMKAVDELLGRNK